MKPVLVVLGMFFFVETCFAQASASHYPEVRFYNLTPNAHTVFYGEEVTLSMRMTFSYLKYHQEWRFPANIRAQPDFGVCAPFISTKVDLLRGDCYFSLIIKGEPLGNVISGAGLFSFRGRQKGLDPWYGQPDLDFSVRVIPHPLSMANIPIQSATANFPVYIDLKPYVNYYNENSEAGTPAIVEVIPPQIDGLYYDPARFAIVGKPLRTGTYQFSIAAQNIYSKAASVHLNFDVGVNQHDKPIFKRNYAIDSAMPGQPYQLNLMDLIELRPSFLLSNAVNFRIDKNESHPDWLSISGASNTLLFGNIPANEAGTSREVTLIASSNTGGDSESLKLIIPIATDPAAKARINIFSLVKSAGTEFEYDVRKHIVDPAEDTSLKLIIDKVEPAASWLSVSSTNKTTLLGRVPNDSTGRNYHVSLHANTKMGGDSAGVNILLKIATDLEKVPRFKAVNPQLPIVHPGSPFEHDFVLNRDVFPDFEYIPYVIEMAPDYNNPSWLRVENNKLIADLVPDDLDEQNIKIYLTITNIPGGKSAVIPLRLFAMI